MNLFPIPSHPISGKAAYALFKFAQFLEESGLEQLIRKLAYPIFRGTTSSYLAGFGSLELLQAHQKAPSKDRQASATDLKSSSVYLNTHGGLIAASGIGGIMETLEYCGVATFGAVGPAIFKASNLCFLGANIIALEENVRLYNAVSEAEDSLSGKPLLMLSAISGIISNLGYIFATSVLLLGGPVGIALAIGVVGACSGAYKILCDFILWKREYDNTRQLGP